jgi:MFS family permease
MASAATPSAGSVMRTYYFICGVYTLAASLIWGINTLFLLGAGLSLMQVFLANAVFTGSMALFEVPTGVVADTSGRRLSFLLSVSTLLVGTAAYVAIPALGGGLLAFSIASIVLGLGYTFYSGATEAWLVDALKAAGYTDTVDRVLARGQLVASGAMLVGSVSGGFLGARNLALPYVVRCGLLLTAFLVGLVAMRDVGFERRRVPARDLPRQMARTAEASVRFGWHTEGARLAILAGAVPAIFFEWGYHAWQPYFLGLLGSDAAWVTGTIAAAIALSMMAGNWLVDRLTRFCGRRSTLLIWAAIVFSLTAITVGLVHSFWLAVGFYLVGMMSYGVSQPVRQGYLHVVVAPEQRATVLSFASLVSSGGSMAGQAGLGWLAARGSLATGYVIGGLVTVLAIPLLFALRRLGGVPDHIFGKIGRFSRCPGLATPAGALLPAPAVTEHA